MSNIPNSNRYQSTGRNNMCGETASSTPPQRSQQVPGGGVDEARRHTPNQMTQDGKKSGNAIWLWLAGLAFFLYLFPIQTLSLIALLIAAACLSAKG